VTPFKSVTKYLYSTPNTPQYNVIQTVTLIQCFVTDLNNVTQKGLNKTRIVKMMTILTFGRNEDHLKHSVKMRTIRNKYYENGDEKGI